MNLINYCHSILNLPKQDEAWHRKDIQEELIECQEAEGFYETWSELSDLSYTYTRSIWSGYKSIKFPLSTFHLVFGIVYMIPKYTLRWYFFRKLGYQFDKNLQISEVRNPKKTEKLVDIAKKHQLDPNLFRERAEKLLQKRILLN